MDNPDAASHLPTMADPDAASLEAAIEVPITVGRGPVGPLLRKLHSLMDPEQSLAPDLLSADEIRLLKVLCISLMDMSEDEDASFMVRWWMKMVRELCYDSEDHLDEVRFAGVNFNFSVLLARAKDACERRKCFRWTPPKTIVKPADRREAGVGCQTSQMFLHLDLDAVEPPSKLVELLALDDDEKTLKVIPILGCAGVGKTTIARALYHRHAGKFQCRAFVTVSRNPDMSGFLTSILSQLKAPPPQHGFPDVPDLMDAIKKHLQGKRYFIVIDDLWSASVWNIISRYFPRGDYCSRIIATTQIDDVALACCNYDSEYIYVMAPLNDYESRKLFFARLFGSEDDLPTHMKDISSQIIWKCRGLPLAIINIASLLAIQPNILMEKWKSIEDFLSSTSEGVNNVLNLMYNSLPPDLVTCLLYLSMYAQGYVIKKDELVNQWVAEGFLSAVEGQDTKQIAKGYFDELVCRGVIQAVDTDYNGEVLSCTVHQMVLDFIRCKSRDENFVITVDYNQSTLTLPDKVRRLSVQFGRVQSAYITESIPTSHVRSLMFWGVIKCIPPIMEYKFLRVLVLCIWADQEKSLDLTGMGKLFLLKYLKIESNITIKFPDKIQGLQQLETLQVDARVSNVPSDIVRLQKLLHLRLPSKSIQLHVVGQMTSLRTLGYFDIGSHSEENVLHLARLTNLQDLQLTCSIVWPAEKLEKNVQLLGLILEELIVLRSITLVPDASGSSCVNIPEDGLSMVASPLSYLLLQRIELSRHCCIFFSLPKWFGGLRKLYTLKIAIRQLSKEDIDILKGLPALTALTLYIQEAPEERRIIIDEEGFQVLKYFKFMCVAPCLTFAREAMPRVRKVKLGFSSTKMEPNSFQMVGFLNLKSLAEVSVKFGVQDAEKIDIKLVEYVLGDAVRNHPNTPIIRVQSVFDGEEDMSTSTEEKVEKHGEIQEGKKKMKETSDTEEKRHEIEEDEKKIMERSEDHVSKQDKSRYAPSVDVVMGAMGSLLPKLLGLLNNDEHKLEAKVKDSVRSLYEVLEGMQDALRCVAKLEADQHHDEEHPPYPGAIWARDVRDLSYDAEDVLDSLPVCIDGPQGFITRVSERLSRKKARREFADAIHNIKIEAKELAEQGRRYPFGSHNAANPNVEASFVPRLMALHEDPNGLVGINVPRDEVISKLTQGTGDEFKQLRIVSIIGVGGLGKTTLAKAVYDRIQMKYDYAAFVFVPRSHDMRKLYINMLLEIDKQKYRNLKLAIFDERQLIDEVRELLADKSYMIIFDGVFHRHIWEAIKFTMIDSGRGSRVVITTRLPELANMACEVFNLEALPPSHSRELFNTRLFGGKINIPSGLPKEYEIILHGCAGIPLTLITMASLLAGKPTDLWSKVYSNIGFGSKDGYSVMKILLSVYYDLPYYLRACLLCLHIFPENCLIKKETLLWKWAAEGLIVEKPEKGLFELGEGYLQELIHKGVVIPIEDDSHPGKVMGCRVHDLVLEMMHILTRNEKFVTVAHGSSEYSSVERNARRLAVKNWRAEQGDPLLYTRRERLRSFNATGCLFSMELSLSRFKLLRVIAIEECTFLEGRSCDLKHLAKLHQLRYLGLYNTHIVELPEDIGDLIYLQTLDLRGTRVRELPRGVARLRQLKCLRADEGTTVGMGNLTSLEELRLGDVGMSGNFVEELGKLTELRELHIWIGRLDENQRKALVQSMRKLEKIQVLRLMAQRSFGGHLNWGDFDPPPELHELHLSILSYRLPAWINVCHVPVLSHLYVNVMVVEDRDLDILGALPELISLELVIWSNVLHSIKGNGAFPKLRRFHTSSTLRFLPGAMLRLEFLHFKVDVQALEDASVKFDDDFVASTLKYLPSLQNVEVEISSTSGVEAIHEALKRAVHEHPNSPSLQVVETDQVGTAHRRLL